MSARNVLCAALLVLTGCAGQLRIPGLMSFGAGTSSETSSSTSSTASQPAAASQSPAEREAEKAKAAEAAKKEEEIKALAAKTQELVVPELGIKITVPGDVKAKVRDVAAYGTPDVILEGAGSYFTLIVTDATKDRYGINERLTKQQSEFRYGMDVIRREEKPGGAWEFEYSYPLYYQDGTSAGTEMGYFSRKVVAGKKYNCLLSGLSQKKLDAVIVACDSIVAAKNVASK